MPAELAPPATSAKPPSRAGARRAAPPASRPTHLSLRSVLRLAAVLAALGLAMVPLWQHRRLAERREEVTLWLEGAGVPAPAELGREPDPGRVELRAVRAALDAELDAARRASPGSAVSGVDREDQRGGQRMADTARRAGAVLATRPAAWEAALVRGAATYLSWSIAQDSRLYSQAPRWEEPLAAAVALAPNRPEPTRFLAAAYLESWRALSPAKRQRARELLTVAFTDPPTLAALLAPWLAATAQREEAFAAIPADPAAWAKVEEIYAGQRDWAGFCAARRRHGEVLLGYLDHRLALAETLRAQGGEAEAGAILLEVVAAARPGRPYLDLVRRALSEIAPGPITPLEPKVADRLVAQFVWTLERCLLDRCPLAEPVIRRLAGLCRGRDPVHEAMAALVLGDLQRAESLEHAADHSLDAAWAGYRLLKARWLAGKGRSDEAAAALALVPPAWLSRPVYWEVRAALARAAGEPAAAAQATQSRARLAAHEWPAAAWDWNGMGGMGGDGRDIARLELLTDLPPPPALTSATAGSPGLELTFDVAPAEGAAIEVRFDEASLGTFPAVRGATLALAVPVTPGLHLLEVESVAGGAVLPGRVRLLGGAGEPR